MTISPKYRNIREIFKKVLIYISLLEDSFFSRQCQVAHSRALYPLFLNGSWDKYSHPISNANFEYWIVLNYQQECIKRVNLLKKI